MFEEHGGGNGALLKSQQSEISSIGKSV